MSGRNKPNELYITRIYDAPVQMVWEAWTDPRQVAQWWGPRGFTLTTHGKDLRPGGHWTYTMHGPDGTDYPNKTLYLEVEKHSRLVYDHGGNDDRPPMFRVTVVFTELRGRTKMEMTMALATAEAAAEARKFIKKAGGDSTWDRLAEYLGHAADGKDRFVINRTFEAPLETLFRMWTDPKHFARWLPPAGFTMEVLGGELRTGGTLNYAMSNGADVTMYGRVSYREIAPPDRLVYTQQFCDRDGNVSRHPHAPVWPETMLTTIAFHAEEPNRTRVTVTWEPYGETTAAERKAFHDEKGGMTQGWTGSFDKLDAELAR